MQRSAARFASQLGLISVLAAGCSEGVGTCEDPAGGRQTAAFGRGVAYVGQAILTSSCASGCHSSLAKGEARQGAPASLDFDLAPITNPTPGPALTGSTGAIVGVQVDAAQLAGLRSRQRKVFDERDDIWEQVEKGLMPPGGGLALNVVRTVFGADGACTGMGNLANDTQAKQDLRNWLACGAPVVEASSALLPYVPPANQVEQLASGAAAYSGSVGYQYPECKMDVGPGGPTFQQVYNTVLSSATYGCTSSASCHGTGAAIFDIGTIDKAYTLLLGPNGQGGAQSCGTNPAPYVKPGDPVGSYLVAKLNGGGAFCLSPMPLGGTPVSPADLDLLRQWITAGAMR
jgi:hypothetical protein